MGSQIHSPAAFPPQETAHICVVKVRLCGPQGQWKAKSLVHTGVRVPGRPARREQLTRLDRADPMQIVHVVTPLYFKGVHIYIVQVLWAMLVPSS